MNWDWELVVCDNNSSDRTAELARDAGARVVLNPKTKSPERNTTGQAAREIGSFLWMRILNRAQVIRGHRQTMQQSDILGGGSRLPWE